MPACVLNPCKDASGVDVTRTDHLARTDPPMQPQPPLTRERRNIVIVVVNCACTAYHTVGFILSIQVRRRKSKEHKYDTFIITIIGKQVFIKQSYRILVSVHAQKKHQEVAVFLQFPVKSLYMYQLYAPLPPLREGVGDRRGLGNMKIQIPHPSGRPSMQSHYLNEGIGTS